MTAHAAHEPYRSRGTSFWMIVLLAAVFLIVGVPIFAGGLWLIVLGGSWYYAVAGIGLLATAVLLFRHSMLAVWIYGLTFVFTLIWAFWEVGLDWWAQVPRLVGPAILLLLVLASIPTLRRHRTGDR